MQHFGGTPIVIVRSVPLLGHEQNTVGIDLGTTNTVIARNFRPLTMEGGGTVMPSAVAFAPSGATRHRGTDASVADDAEHLALSARTPADVAA